MSASVKLKSIRRSTFFDLDFYLKSNPDVKAAGIDPALHYLKYGGFEGRDPGPLFSSNAYLVANPDVARARLNPLLHFELYGRQEGRKLGSDKADPLADRPEEQRKFGGVINVFSKILRRRYFEFLCTLGRSLGKDKLKRRGEQYWNDNFVGKTKAQGRQDLTPSKVFALTQDLAFPAELQNSEKLMVIVVPENNVMSGGIYSLFSIAQRLRHLKWYHGYEIVVLTRPNPQRLTYFRNTNFTNSENVYRFEQIMLCRSAKDVYLHIPEYIIDRFAYDLSKEERQYLLSKENLHINVLNQNIRLMPSRQSFSALREICGSMSQSVAHHAYFNQSVADKYGLPTILVPAFTDLSAYPPASFDEKEKLIIYSPDFAPHKAKCLAAIARDLPDFKLLEIRDITFDKFMDLATKCMFSLSFGEGFDGYLAQPMHQGGISFTVYNNEFFPSEHFKKYLNIFNDEEEMLRDITHRISHFSRNKYEYRKLNEEFVRELDKLYSFDVYTEQLRKLVMKEFEFLPQ